MDFTGLPGAERIGRGLRDLAEGSWTPDAWLVAMATTRLRDAGVAVPAVHPPREPELALYEALGREQDDPYGRYNALRRELVSFLDALDARVRRERRSGAVSAAVTR